MDPKTRIDILCQKINQANYEYYVLDNPTISDQEYDDYFLELRKLEDKYPELKKEDSPTVKVGGEALDKFEKIQHQSFNICCNRPYRIRFASGNAQFHPSLWLGTGPRNDR